MFYNPRAVEIRKFQITKKVSFQVVKRSTEAIQFMKTPWPILSEEKYLMDEESWEVAIEEQDCQQAIAGASVGTSYVCQLPSSTSLNIDLEEHDAVSHRICVMLLYQTNNIDHSPKYSKLKLKNSTI